MDYSTIRMTFLYYIVYYTQLHIRVLLCFIIDKEHKYIWYEGWHTLINFNKFRKVHKSVQGKKKWIFNCLENYNQLAWITSIIWLFLYIR